jgi:hypothetical protein
MLEYPTENGRIVNPYNPTERPTFLPGDKVSDNRDRTGVEWFGSQPRVWRIVARVAYGMSELMTLREVGDDSNERTVSSHQLVPHLRMVAMSARA